MMNNEKKNKRKFDLEDRLIDFAIRISEVAESLPNTALGKYIKGQMIRSGTSPALNYGEAQSSESTNDFVHKLKVVLKELRETLVCLKIIKRKPLITPVSKLSPIIEENNELISIFVKSIETAKKNSKKEKM
ncbi:MAG: four helix bundle protein [Bacteroidales bacterium]|nr:four helix bundle protein [Bacteroidales bacterium]